jgi:uncharacterized protein (DUF885 family)
VINNLNVRNNKLLHQRRRSVRSSIATVLLFSTSAAAVSCHHNASPVGNPSSPAPPTSHSSALAEIANAYWQGHLHADPIDATLLGIHGYDDRMPDESPDARASEQRRLKDLRVRLDAQAPEAALTAVDRITSGLLAGQIDGDLAFIDCHLEEWAVDPRDGPQVAYLDLAGLQSVKTPADGQALLARWRAIPRTLDQKTANLLRGLAAGKASAKSEVERVLRQLDELLAKPDADWPLMAPTTRLATGAWPDSARDQFKADLARAVSDGIRPAFARYRTAIRDRILPHARGDATVGIRNIPGGDACYLALARVHTSTVIDPAAVHRLGLEQLQRIRSEMQALGPAAVGSSDFAVIQRLLRGQPKDPAMFFATREQIEATARAALGRATAAQPQFLGRLPRTPCDIKSIEAHEEKDAPIAYYRQPSVDGSRPGTYYVNTFDPTSRPRFESESLAFHEAVPGHHVQITLAQEMTGVPEFRKHMGVTAFVEGWGLYAERLADELGLYSTPLTRMGRLSLESWRAARLVVDTGIHALGWGRADAVRFLTENTVIAPNNIENEVDRYIGWPAQALAYKIGEQEILRLRARAHERLGPRSTCANFTTLFWAAAPSVCRSWAPRSNDGRLP